MNLRPFAFPKDYEALLNVTVSAYQYDEHPEWSVPHNLGDMLAPQYEAVRTYYKLLRAMAVVDKRLRHVLQGILAEDDGEAVGLAMMVRLYQSPRLELGNVGVIPTYRQQGIARQLVEAAISTGREQGLQQIELNVIEGNAAAHRLYSSLGFERVGETDEFINYDLIAAQDVRLPAGFRAHAIGFGQGKHRATLIRHLGHTVSNERFTMLAGLRWLARPIFGAARMKFVGRYITTTKDEPAAYVALLVQPGTTTGTLIVDPAYPALFEMLLHWCRVRSARLAPAMPLALTLEQPEWRAATFNAGYTRDFVNVRMCLKL